MGLWLFNTTENSIHKCPNIYLWFDLFTNCKNPETPRDLSYASQKCYGSVFDKFLFLIVNIPTGKWTSSKTCHMQLLCEDNTILWGGDSLPCSIQGDPCPHPPVGIIAEPRVSRGAASAIRLFSTRYNLVSELLWAIWSYFGTVVPNR